MGESASDRILVLLASRNGMPWIQEQVASVLAQEQVDVTILVSDDASTDGTREFIEALAERDPRVRLLPMATPSGSACANFLRLFRSADLDGVRYVAFCDQDDIWHHDKLKIASQALETSNAVLYSCACTAFWPDGRTAALVQSRRVTDFDHLFEGAGQGCTFVLAQAHFRRIQTFVRLHAAACRPLHFHDWLVYALTRTWGGQWLYDRTPRMRYRQHAANEIGARSGLSGWKRRLHLIRSGWYTAQVRAMISICMLASAHLDTVQAVDRMLNAKHSTRNNLAQAVWLLRHGRRKWADRTVLCVAAICGWL